LTTRDSLTSDEAGLLATGFLSRKGFDPDKIDRVVIGSVVPHLTSAFEETARKYLGCESVVVSSDLKLPVTIDIDRPHQAGADRLANAAAAFTRWGGPLIVVDFGTATTFDIVNSDGAYIGGVISPGHRTSMIQLVRRTAQLSEVRIEPPLHVVGRDTETALKSGLFHGTVGQVDYIIDKIIEETAMVDPTIIATGGLATGIEVHSRYIQKVEPDLTLDGLRIIGEMNR
jgi:type III pantothenate kinase